MAARKASPERMGAFSDGVIAVIITIMVLELKAPHTANARELLALWPMFAVYALSYLFVGIVWVNHHHLLRYAERAEPCVIWSNLLFLFFVSLIPFFTAYVADNWLAAFPTAVYAGIFLLATVAFMLFQAAIARQTREQEAELRVGPAATRDWIALGLCAAAIPVAYVSAVIALALVVSVTMLYFVPDAARMVRG